MDAVIVLRWLHVIGATVLLGTGAGIAFFMVVANRTRDARLIAHVAGTVVLADLLFTATAVVLQPITGYLLARSIGWPLTEGWLLLSLILYAATGLFWLPVVWIQLRLRDLARKALQGDGRLGKDYRRFYGIWLACGFPAFAAVLAIIWLMVARPRFTLL